MTPPAPPRPTRPDLTALLTDIATGRVSVEQALQTITAEQPQAAIDGVTLDLDRQRRCGYPEVIYGAGKPAEMIAEIMHRQHAAGQSSLATRVSPDVAESVQSSFPHARFNPLARTLSCCIDRPDPPRALELTQTTAEATPDAHPPRHVAVITAGSTDAAVAAEAIETLHWMDIPHARFEDIGVAGPARLLAAVPLIRQAAAVVVIAGMEGALPAAVGGHLHVPVFAVPTSVGYGATLGGLTPLMGMLSACASNVAVVNIDAGFKAAYLAGLVAQPARNR